MCFFFNDTATTEIYTLSLHDALPICSGRRKREPKACPGAQRLRRPNEDAHLTDVRDRRKEKRIRCDTVDRPLHVVAIDRKSTRLNSSHANISYAVFCLKKKKKL